MSSDARVALAEAATTVEGVNVTPYGRQTTRPGDGWVRLSRISYPNKFGGVVTWQVLVAMPQDTRTAEMWIDEHVAELVAALAPEMRIESAEPFTFQPESTNQISVIAITGTREQD